MADLRQPRSVVADGDWVWMLTLRVAGRWVRLVSGPDVDVTSRTDGTHRYLSGLSSGGLARALDVFADGPSERSASFAVALSFDLALAIEQGHTLHGSRGELAQWWVGEQFEDRRIVLEGVLREPAYGDVHDLFEFTIREALGDDRGVFLTPTEIVTRDTFPAGIVHGGPLGSEDVDGLWGVAYPIVIGSPGGGHVEDVSGTLTYFDVPATPAMIVEQQQPSTGAVADYRFMVCRGVAEDIGRTVEIINKTATASNFAGILAVGNDGQGRDYTYVQPPGVAGIPDKSDETWCTWVVRGATPETTASTSNPFNVGGLRSAGDVIRWALSLSTLRIDNTQIGRLAALNGFLVDTYINDPELSPWAWVRDTLLPILPASAVFGPDGLYVAAFNYGATTAQAVERLEVGRNCERSPDTLVSYGDEGNVHNRITISYALDASTGQYTRTITLGAVLDNQDAAPKHPALAARRSQGLFGVRPKSVEAPWIYDSASAEAAIQAMLLREALPPRRVSVTTGPELSWLRPGDVVDYSDAGLHLTNRPAHVEAIAAAEGLNVEIGLVLFDTLAYTDG